MTDLVRIARSQVEFLCGRQFYGDDRFVWVSRARIAELMREWDESEHPRDEDGKFTFGGGGDEEGSGGGSDSTIGGSSTATDKPRIIATVDKEQRIAIESAIEAVPKDHLKAIGNLEIEGHLNLSDLSPQTGLAGFYGHRDPGNQPIIVISKRLNYDMKVDGKTVWANVQYPETVTVHELGHALDFMKDNKISEDIGRAVIDEAFFGKLSNSFGPGKNITDAIPGSTYFLKNPHEAFAELYALQYSPNKSATFFGMDKPLAELMFQKSLAKLRAMHLSKYPTTELLDTAVEQLLQAEK